MLYRLSYASKLRDRAFLRRKSPYGSLSDDRDNFKRYHTGKLRATNPIAGDKPNADYRG